MENFLNSLYNIDPDQLNNITNLVLSNQSSNDSNSNNQNLNNPDNLNSDNLDSDQEDLVESNPLFHIDNSNIKEEVDENTSLDSEGIDFDEINYGCKHYLRRCKFISPCCNEIFYCRFCHDEKMMSSKIPILKRHNVNRYNIKKIICDNCNHEQSMQQFCEKCFICFGSYFCNKCNLFDDIDKSQYHCEKCGLCRINSVDNYHCDGCNICLPTSMKDNHVCMSIKEVQCPVCMEDLSSSILPVAIMKCGHYIHRNCFINMLQSSFKCPICLKSAVDISEYNNLMDQHIASAPMPDEYKDIDVNILCNDCGKDSITKLHFNGHKCCDCGSYNTRKL